MAAYDGGYSMEGDESLFGVPSEMDAQRVLAQTVRRNPALSMPTGGVPQRRATVAPAQMPPAPPADTNSEPLPTAPAPKPMTAAESLRLLIERQHERPDTTADVEAAKRRAERSDRDMIVSIGLAGKGGENFRPLAQTLGAHAVKESGDYEIPGGWGRVTPSGEVAWNSAKLKENEDSRLTKIYGIQSAEESRRDIAKRHEDEMRQRGESDRALRLTLGGMRAGASGDAANAVNQQRMFMREQALAKDYEDATKLSRKEAAAAQRALTLTDKPPEQMSAMDQMGLVYTVMKMFDPDSVVRESEYAMAQSAQGLPDRLKNLYTQLQTGKRLNPQQVTEMRDIAQRYAALAGESITAQDSIFAERARRWNIDPANIGRTSTGMGKPPGGAPAGAAPPPGGGGLPPGVKVTKE